MNRMTEMELAGVYASAQSMYEREHNLTYKGSIVRFNRDRDFYAAGMLAQAVASECIAFVHDGLNDAKACDPIESNIEARFGIGQINHF